MKNKIKKIDYRGTKLPAHKYEKFVNQKSYQPKEWGDIVSSRIQKCVVIMCSNKKARGKEGFCKKCYLKI